MKPLSPFPHSSYPQGSCLLRFQKGKLKNFLYNKKAQGQYLCTDLVLSSYFLLCNMKNHIEMRFELHWLIGFF